MPERLDAKLLYRRLDSLFGAFDPSLPQTRILESFLEDAFGTLRDDLRLASGHLYRERRDGFELLKNVGHGGPSVGEVLDPHGPHLSLIFRHQVYIFAGPGSPSSPPGLGLSDSAGLVVGRRPDRHVIFFRLSTGWIREELDFTLNTIRAALGSRLLESKVRGSVQQAAEIQQSLLLEEAPAFRGFEIACRSVPAEEVGGDFFDFYNFGSDILGLSIGDASGHGLPAALLVRDVVTGLRIGLEKNLKMAHVFDKLNRVIHRSNLSSRFISVFYAELESDGNLIYVNAGHPPPLLFSEGGTSSLAQGGTVIGPLPEASFRRGIARVDPGAVLVLCTDGILERREASGEFFGEDGLVRVVGKSRSLSAEQILEGIFASAFAFGDARPWEDDATCVVVRRLAPPEGETLPKP
jgi:sigma-B regulation protein RsbU (phosphoserine phosphatase)